VSKDAPDHSQQIAISCNIKKLADIIRKNPYVPLCTMGQKCGTMVHHSTQLYIMKTIEQMVLDGLNEGLVQICLRKWCTIVGHFACWDMNYTFIIHKFRQFGDLIFQNLGRLTANNIPIYYIVIRVDKKPDLVRWVVRSKGQRLTAGPAFVFVGASTWVSSE